MRPRQNQGLSLPQKSGLAGGDRTAFSGNALVVLNWFVKSPL